MVNWLGVAGIAMPSILSLLLCVYIKLHSPISQKDSYPIETLPLFLFLVANVLNAGQSIVILGGYVSIVR